MKLKYKVQVNLTGIDKEGNQINTSIEEYFVNDNPIVARKQAISKLNSYKDVFKDAEETGQTIINNWGTAFDDNLKDFKIPKFELYYCPSYDGFNFEEFALYSYVLLETKEEIYTELSDELAFIKSEFSEIHVDTILVNVDGQLYTIISDSPIMDL